MDRHQVISLSSRLRESSCEEIIKRRELLDSPVLSRSNFAQIAPEFDEARIAFCLVLLFPRQNLVDFRKRKSRIR